MHCLIVKTSRIIFHPRLIMYLGTKRGVGLWAPLLSIPVLINNLLNSWGTCFLHFYLCPEKTALSAHCNPCFRKEMLESGFSLGILALEYMLLIISLHWNSWDLWLLLFSDSVVSNSLWPHELQHVRLPCSSPSPRACSNSCPLNWWCHPTISSSVGTFSACFQYFPAKGSFPMSQFFASGGQSIGVSASASILPMNIQDWSPFGWTGWTILCL